MITKTCFGRSFRLQQKSGALCSYQFRREMITMNEISNELHAVQIFINRRTIDRNSLPVVILGSQPVVHAFLIS